MGGFNKSGYRNRREKEGEDLKRIVRASYIVGPSRIFLENYFVSRVNDEFYKIGNLIDIDLALEFKGGMKLR